MEKILIVTFSMSIGGLENILMSYYKELHNKYCIIDFLIHKEPEDKTNMETILGNSGKVIQMQTPGQLGALKYLKELKKLILKNGPYKAVHANTEYHGGLVNLAAKLAGVDNRICHSHTTNVNKKTNLLLMPLYKTLISCFSTKKISCSQLAGEFMYFGNFEVLPNAIEVDRYQDIKSDKLIDMKKKFGINDKELVLAQIGRLSSEKNHKFSLDLVYELKKKNASVTMLFIGDGDLRVELENYSKKHDVDDIVKFVGYQHNINEILHLVDYLLLPSFYEGLPVTLIEAQAAGVNCLVSNNITKEVDLNMGLLTFLDINDKNEWVKVVLSTSKEKLSHQNYSKEEVKKRFNERKYDLNSVTNRLMELYGIR